MIWAGVIAALVVGGVFLAERITRPSGYRRKESDGSDGGFGWFGDSDGGDGGGDGGGGD